MKRYLYIFASGEMKNLGLVEIDENRYVYTKGNPEGVPIEDFDYVLSDEEITKERAFHILTEQPEDVMNKLSKRELARRFEKIAKAFEAQRQTIINGQKLTLLLSAKLYNHTPEDEIFKGFQEDFMKTIIQFALALKNPPPKNSSDGSLSSPPSPVEESKKEPELPIKPDHIMPT